MNHKQSYGCITVASAVLAAGLSPLDAAPVAHTGPLIDTVLMSQADDFDLLTGATATGDPLADISQIPDVATSGSVPLDNLSDPDFISNIHDLGLFTVISAADPDDDFVAFVIQTPIFTDILTSGADPEGNLGFGDAGIGLAGATVNTFESSMFPALDSTFTLPFPDPFADLFTFLVQLGL